jgi:ribosomal protein S27E
MRKRNSNSRALRQLAVGLLQQIDPEGEVPDDERDEFVTSLVRQWITYDGNATAFVGERQAYLVLGRTPLGKPCVVPEPGLAGWVEQLRRDWRIGPDDLPEVLDQLNRGQSAEVVNGDGIPLRLWVNPKEKSRGVEPLVREGTSPGRKWEYRQIAATEFEQQFGDGLDPEEMDELACSVAKQWQEHEGHACLFIDGHEQFHFKLTEHGDGSCEVVTSRLSIDLEPALSAFGFAPDVQPELIARINLGQQIEFRDRAGVRSRLWHDPKARRICVQALDPDPVRPTARADFPPIFCPNCTAVLRVWREGEQQQTCPLCGHVVSLL